LGLVEHLEITYVRNVDRKQPQPREKQFTNKLLLRYYS